MFGKRRRDMTYNVKGQTARRRVLCVAVAVLMILGAFFAVSAAAGNGDAYAAGKNVKVYVPAFKVTINGTEVDNAHRQYPFITYKDITYFPMTFYDCQYLGAASEWTPEKGLVIDVAEGTTYESQMYYDFYVQKQKNAKSYTASIVTGDVTINGIRIDNPKEPYPLLIFRDVTYFPMTWRFCVDEFSWCYSFSAKDGLNISAIEKNYLSDGSGRFYETTGGRIMYIAEKDWSYDGTNADKAKLVWSVPKNTIYTDNYPPLTLYSHAGKYYARYRTGGGVMGSDHTVRLTPSGGAEYSGLGNYFYDYDDVVFSYSTFVPPFPGNLYAQRPGDPDYASYEEETEATRIGDPDYIYGWAYNVSADGSEGGSPGVSGIYYDGKDSVYVLAFRYNNPDAEARAKDNCGVYRVSVSGGDVTRITGEDEAVYWFEVKDGVMLYKTVGTNEKNETFFDPAVKTYSGPESFADVK